METYTIQLAYPKRAFPNNPFSEVEIASDNLLYSEMGTKLNGVQCLNSDNYDAIKNKCAEVAELMREIDKLNKIPPEISKEDKKEDNSRLTTEQAAKFYGKKIPCEQVCREGVDWEKKILTVNSNFLKEMEQGSIRAYQKTN